MVAVSGRCIYCFGEAGPEDTALRHRACGSEAMETVPSDQGLQSTVAKAERKATGSTFDVGSKEGGGGRQVQESGEGAGSRGRRHRGRWQRTLSS